MRLLDTVSLELKEFTDSSFYDKHGSRLISYAILSHTWGEEEVSFQDMLGDREKAETKLGFSKIKNSCEVAANHNIKYIWIDTCCIDKSSSSELSEAINSMFQWYSDCEICYAYMGDVTTTPETPSLFHSSFSASRWFTRGWTLQELIAPRAVDFYNKHWHHIGTKKELIELIGKATDIDLCVLGGYIALTDFTVARRMSWASRRETTRVEDMAYCLLGIFDINMPLLYGEKEKAFIRLQEAIMKTTDDQSLFVWKEVHWYGSGDNVPLATSPFAFRDSGTVTQIYRERSAIPLSLSTNKAVRVNVLLCEDIESYSSIPATLIGRSYFGVLSCEIGTVPGVLAGIKLFRRPNSSDYNRTSLDVIFKFARCDPNGNIDFRGFGPSSEQDRLTNIVSGVVYNNWKPASINITPTSQQVPPGPQFRILGPRHHEYGHLEVEAVYPPELWDPKTYCLRFDSAMRLDGRPAALKIKLGPRTCILLVMTARPLSSSNDWCITIPWSTSLEHESLAQYVHNSLYTRLVSHDMAYDYDFAHLHRDDISISCALSREPIDNHGTYIIQVSASEDPAYPPSRHLNSREL